MMCPNVVSGFIANADRYNVPPNNTLIIFQVQTWDRQNMLGDTFTISASGYSQSVTADASGRAYKLVPSGATYTITLTHNGHYLNDEDQVVVANSEEVVWVNYILSLTAIETFENVSASSWTADSTYEDFPYKCAVALTGVAATDVPEVVFGVAEATSGNYAPVAECYDGGIYIWSSVQTAITIPTVIIKRTA